MWISETAKSDVTCLRIKREFFNFYIATNPQYHSDIPSMSSIMIELDMSFVQEATEHFIIF